MPRSVGPFEKPAATACRNDFPISSHSPVADPPRIGTHQFTTDSRGEAKQFRYLWEGFEWFFGNSAESLLDDTQRAKNRVLTEDRPVILKALAVAALAGDALDINVRYETDEGGLGWCRILSVPRRQNDGSLIWDGVHFDVTPETERRHRLRDFNALLNLRLKSRRSELDRAHETLSNMETLTRVGSWVYDPSEPNLEWSESVFEMFGLPPKSTPPTFEEFLRNLPDDQRSMIEDIVNTKDFKRTWDYKLTVSRPDGSTRTLWARARLERKKDSTIPILFGVCHDITDKDAAEAASERSQKMGAIGKLTSGLAHDFNNLLSITIGNLDLIKSKLSEEALLLELCDEALSAALRGAGLTKQLMLLSRNEIQQPKAVSLCDLINRFKNLLNSSSSDGAPLITDLHDAGCSVYIDPGQFESALLNLVVNARHAMPQGGTLSIHTSLHLASVGDPLGLQPGPYVLTKVSDTGTGMPQEVIDRAFEPFFTTKTAEEGTGLGLSMISAFAKRAGGDIEIVSQVGRGTSVLLYLPCSSAAKEVQISHGAQRYGTGSTDYTVLLVDDDPGVRKVTERLLTDMGYMVMTVDNGVSALSLLRQVKADILLTDVVMPDMTGVELATAAIEKYPGLLVVYTSGIGHDELMTGSQVHLLPKPFTKSELFSKLQEAMQRPTPAGLPVNVLA